jgi:hypothetical protein
LAAGFATFAGALAVTTGFFFAGVFVAMGVSCSSVKRQTTEKSPAFIARRSRI